MKLTKGKKIALTSFAAFLAFMAVCTIVAKGIHASGLPRVTTVKPYSGSLTHVITVKGTVVQGQEYGVYVEAGLRVDTVAVGRGEVFQAGQELFRIETGDLETIIGERCLEIAKLEARMADAVEEDSSGRKSRKREAERAKQDYDRAAVLADARIEECRQALETARKALSLYDQYLADLARNPDNGGNGGDGSGEAPGEDGSGGNSGNGGNETGGIGEMLGGTVDASGSSEMQSPINGRKTRQNTAGALHQVGSVVDPKEQYDRQEKRLQLEQNVITAAQALEEAERQKEDSLKEAARAMEDADAAIEDANAEVNVMALDIAYQKESLQKLEKLLETDGWIYAEASGRVIESSLEVGGRVPDGASLTYALDGGQRLLSAAFTEEQAGHISVGTPFEMRVTTPDGRKAEGTALVDYLEKGEEGIVRARLSFELEGISIGQSAELTYRMQTDSYGACLPRSCLYQESENSYYVYLAEERKGILGTEWKVRKVSVRVLDQNDSVAAIRNAEIGSDMRIVLSTDKMLTDGDTVRVIQ